MSTVLLPLELSRFNTIIWAKILLTSLSDYTCKFYCCSCLWSTSLWVFQGITTRSLKQFGLPFNKAKAGTWVDALCWFWSLLWTGIFPWSWTPLPGASRGQNFMSLPVCYKAYPGIQATHQVPLSSPKVPWGCCLFYRVTELNDSLEQLASVA